MIDAADLVGRLAPLVGNVGSPATAKITERLPSLHRELLGSLNGFTVQSGTLRMFGMSRADSLDFDWWNDTDTWRFVWDDRVCPYVFFGATAWGDQYAYRLSPDGGLEPTIFFLEATLLRAAPLAGSFCEFAEAELLKVATLSSSDWPVPSNGAGEAAV